MDQIRENERTLRDSIQRQNFYDISVIDIFTAFHVLSTKYIDSTSLTDDKYFTFLLGVISRIPRGRERQFWFDKMFSIYEKISGITPSDPNWLLLQANLIYLAPVSGTHPDLDDRFQY